MANSDEIIWEKILAGDVKAWEEMVRRYQALVYAVAVRSGLTLSDAADCFQNTWVALYTNRRSIENPEKISSWLVTTAKREALRLNRQIAKETDIIDAGDNPDHRPLPDQELIELERQAQLEIALGEIDPRCRDILKEFFFSSESRSYEEIAKSLGISANSLGPIRHRCLRKLRKILEEKGYIDVRKNDSDTL